MAGAVSGESPSSQMRVSEFRTGRRTINAANRTQRGSGALQGKYQSAETFKEFRQNTPTLVLPQTRNSPSFRAAASDVEE